MRRVIHQYMWGFQHYFRRSLEWSAERALQSIGVAVAPQAIMVGFAASDDAKHRMCVEPENGPYSQGDLAGVNVRAEELFDADPRRQVFHTDPGLHGQRQASLRDGARGRALCEALAASPGGAGRTFLAGPGVPVGAYVVHPVLSVLSDRWSALPALSTGERDGMAVQRSLPLAVVDRLLQSASRDLRRQPPPQSADDDSADAVRAAAGDLVDSIVQSLLRQFLGSGLRQSLDAVAAQPYEGRAGVGTLLLAGPEYPHVDVVVSFDRPVSVRATRELRKVLEMSAPGLALLCDGANVYGMGRLALGHDPRAEDAFVVTVVGRGSWELALPPAPEDDGSTGVGLLRVDNGQAGLPKAPLPRPKFRDTVGRLFPGAGAAGADRLWALAQACARQAHGTMLVVHPRAAEEGQRLHPQALTISPTSPPDDALLAMTGIDGAVLVAPDGRCHAVGVILDGAATGTGDPARGARYNSAVRYLAGQGEGALIIIVSEDGMINLLPDLKPRRDRADVARAVERLVAASEGAPDYEAFFGLVQHVESVAFYLDQAQCDAVNAARQAVEAHRWAKSQMTVSFDLLEPDPRMDDSHWL